MIDHSLSNERLLGMIQKKENGDFFDVGCYGKITNFTETEDGRYQINLMGLSRFFVKNIIKNDLEFITINAKTLKTENTIKDGVSVKEKLLLIYKKDI